MKDKERCCFKRAICRSSWSFLNQTRRAFFCLSPMFQACAEACACDRTPHMSKPVWIFPRFLVVICFIRWVISEGHRNYFKDWCLVLVSEPTFIFDLFLTQWLMAILSKGTKAGHFEPCNSPKLSCTIIWGLCFNFVECECFLESIYPDILALCETNLDDWIDSSNFSVRCFLPLRQRQLNFLLYGPDWP